MSLIRNLAGKVPRELAATRAYSQECKQGLVLGAWEDCCGALTLTPTACRFDEEVKGKLKDMLRGVKLKAGHARVLNNLGHPEFTAVAVAGLGNENAGFNLCENLNECKENVRGAAGAGARALQKLHMSHIKVEPFSNPEAAAEGSNLGVWTYQDFKNKNNRITESCLDIYCATDKSCWDLGVKKAEAQNIARRLEEMPANVMTPEAFSQHAIDILCPHGVAVEVKDLEWIKAHKMNAFSRIAQSSCHKPLFLQLSYCGGSQEDKPVVIVGQGVTFDSGGICLRKCEGMMEFKADMAGAAVVVGAFQALARLGVPVNAIALVPLTENMPGMGAVKPGDVLMGVSSKTIRVDDPRKEGRVVLSDVLSYSTCFTPCILVNVSTLTHHTRNALGSSATALFTNNESMWAEFSKAGAETGDRVWRFPLWKYFRGRLTHNESVDTSNIGKIRGAEPCIGAAFLAEFAPPVAFVHLDITGTGMQGGHGFSYLAPGSMTGRPVRTILQTMEQLACPEKKPSPCKEAGH